VNPDASGASRRIALVAAAAVLLHGLTVLAGWRLSWPLFVSPPADFIPMAPSTALATAVLAAAWVWRVARQPGVATRRAILAVAAAVGALLVVNLVAPQWLDALLGGGAGMFGQVPLGVMSPVTAASMLAVASAIVLEGRANAFSAVLASAATAIGATVALGYLYGTPLLYGTATIPVALPTGLALLFLGLAIVTHHGPSEWPLRALAGGSPRARMLRAFLPVTVLLVMVIGFLNARVRTANGANDVLLTAWIAVAGVVLMAVVVTRLAKRIGRDLERAGEERHRAEQRYRTIFDDTPAGIATTTPEGRILLCNRSLAQMFGMTVDEFASRPIGDYYWDPAERAKVLEGLRETGRMREVELRMRKPDGSPVWLLANVSWLELAGEAPVIETAALDITARKALEQQFWQAQKLDALGSLAGGVAHDFNNVLTAILGSADLLHLQLERDDPRRADVDEIKKACARAAALTRQLLAFSRRQAFESQALQLDASVKDLVPMLRRLIGPTVSLVTDECRATSAIWADPNQIEQVIVNLVVNARDAMPDGGTVTISTRDVRLEGGSSPSGDIPPGAYVELCVQDTGIGMDAQTVARIFEPFFSTKPVGKGTGLGLATVWGIIKQSRGHVVVESSPGAGSAFRSYFPTTDAPIRTAASLPPARRLEGSETILLVEDEEPILNAVSAWLRRQGYEVLTAPDGARAIDIADTFDGVIDLVISDGVLSDVRVPELLDRLRSGRPDTRILLMSGYPEEDVYGHQMVQPDTAFLPKPFTLDALAERVRQVLDAGGRP
jgi:two-component system cell cycle sensor histidine kinase/response regulator CckA